MAASPETEVGSDPCLVLPFPGSLRAALLPVALCASPTPAWGDVGQVKAFRLVLVRPAGGVSALTGYR